MDETKVIQTLLLEFEQERILSNSALKQLPRGDLRITRNGPGRISFFREYRYETAKKRKGIGRDENMIYLLAHKAFLQEKIRRLDHNISVLRKKKTELLPLDPAEIVACLPKHFDLLETKRIIEPGITDKSDYPNPVFDKSIPPRHAPLDTGGLSPLDWARLPYCANTKNMEHLIHRAARGFYSRSKGEVAVLDRYDALGVPYHYDEVIEIGGHYCSPDIVATRADCRLIYHEHAGLKSDGYREDLQEKLRLYASAGIVLGDNLILTFDNEYGGINVPLADALIRDRLHL